MSTRGQSGMGGQRQGWWRIVMAAMAVLVVTAATQADPVTYNKQLNQANYGNLNQNNIPNGGQYMCGPTAAVNSFVYLENAYGGYGQNLVPNNNLIQTAQTVGGANYMNTQQNLQGGGGGAGTWDDMFIYGKYTYMEAVAANQTTYNAQMEDQWGWGNRAVSPPIGKPSWVSDQTTPTWLFLFNHLQSNADVEILITDGDWGHYLTVTGFNWTDVSGDGIIQSNENALVYYIDPATGVAGSSPIFQQVLDGQLYVSYGLYPDAELVMTMSEAPEPATAALLGLGLLAVLRRRQRR